jgi:hypothetical protein
MLKEIKLVFQDILFFISGKADLAEEKLDNEKFLYPIDFSYQLKYKDDHFYPLDSSGVPMRELGKLGRYYLFSRIAAYGLVNWNEYKKNFSLKEKQVFLDMATWVCNNSNDGCYRHTFDLAGMKSGWISCISQGELTSLLVRAYFETGEEKFYVAASNSIKSLFINIEDGGVKSYLPDGGSFFEEYPNTSIKHVLNGCLYALTGLIDFIYICKEEALKKECLSLSNEIIVTINSNIYNWNINGWSTYDFMIDENQRRNYNTITYHILHISFLKYILNYSFYYNIVNNDNIIKMIEIWSCSLQSQTKRLSALSNKIIYRIKNGYQ